MLQQSTHPPPPSYSEEPSSICIPCNKLDDIVFALRTLHDNSGSFAPLQDAVLSCLNALKLPLAESRDCSLLSAEVQALNTVLQRLKSPGSDQITDCAINLALSIKYHAQTLDGEQEWEWSSSGGQQDIFLQPIITLFRQLRVELNGCVGTNSISRLTNIKLERLYPVKLAYDNSAFPSRQLCAKGTCIRTLSELADWATNNGDSVYWMTGSLGTGKTTIATTFSHKLEEGKRLMASFFCNNLFLKRRQVNRIIPTIVYQMAHYSRAFRGVLSKVLDKYQAMESMHITNQFDCLLKNPLVVVGETLPKNLVVVLDALDECDDQAEVELLLSLLNSNCLPIRFLITTRPKAVTHQAIGSAMTGTHQLEKLLAQEDIKRYFEGELSDISLTIDQVERLTHGSGTLFIYATTLARSIRYFSRSVSLQNVLRSLVTPLSIEAEPNIDKLYEAVIRLALEHVRRSGPMGARNLQLVLMVILHAKELVDIDTVSGLIGIGDHEAIVVILNSLQSLLTVSKDGLLSTIHSSFSHFMSNTARLATFFCEPECTQHIAQRCFEVMKSQLRFNICDFDSSHKSDDLVKNLTSPVQAVVPSTLSYACRNWGNYLHLSPWSGQLQDALQEFLSVRLLFWIEVMNLKHLIVIGPNMLLKAQQWVKNANGPSDLECSLDDARKFIQRFATTPMCRSTPHIYISALLFWPHSNFISKCYRGRIHGLTKTANNELFEDVEVITTWQLDSEAKSIGYSANGARVAFGCENGTVEVRDICDNTSPSGPVKAHFTSMVSRSQPSSRTDTICSVALSPDGKHAASGSSDCTVRIWKVGRDNNSVCVLKGHSGPVLSVAYSPNSDLVASGSEDCNIFIWDSLKGAVMHGPLEGHFDAVSSVTFSPGGQRVASGSWDKTIRVWDPYSGTLVAGPFVGHTHPINSISFSLNGAYLVSTSSNGSIGVWDSLSGLGIIDTGLEVFRGHTTSACSAAFSSDTNYVISGSSDQTIRIWDLPTGKPMGAPIYALAEPFTSLLISPNGKYIALCSNDRNVQLWRFPDARTAVSKTSNKSIIHRAIYAAKSNDKWPRKRWELSSDGWIVGEDSTLLLWIPPEVRSSLSTTGSDHVCTIIGHAGRVEVNLSDLPLGESWLTLNS